MFVVIGRLCCIVLIIYGIDFCKVRKKIRLEFGISV